MTLNSEIPLIIRENHVLILWGMEVNLTALSSTLKRAQILSKCIVTKLPTEVVGLCSLLTIITLSKITTLICRNYPSTPLKLNPTKIFKILVSSWELKLLNSISSVKPNIERKEINYICLSRVDIPISLKLHGTEIKVEWNWNPGREIPPLLNLLTPLCWKKDGKPKDLSYKLKLLITNPMVVCGTDLSLEEMEVGVLREIPLKEPFSNAEINLALMMELNMKPNI